MSTQEGGLYSHCALGADLPRNAEHLEFGVPVEAVTRLDLKGRDTFGNQRVNALQGFFQQGRLVCLARCGDCGNNTATGSGDFFIACPVEAHFKFVGAIAAKNNMGVAIDQPWGDQAATAVRLFFWSCLGWDIFSQANPADLTSFHPNSTIVHKPVRRCAVHRCKGGVDQEHQIFIVMSALIVYMSAHNNESREKFEVINMAVLWAKKALLGERMGRQCAH